MKIVKTKTRNIVITNAICVRLVKLAIQLQVPKLSSSNLLQFQFIQSNNDTHPFIHLIYTYVCLKQNRVNSRRNKKQKNIRDSGNHFM